MIFGAEFHRQIWQRFSIFSLLLMPVLAGLLLLFAYLFHSIQLEAQMKMGGSPEFIGHWSEGALPFCIFVVFLILFFYGTYEAASSFVTELKNKTWDLPKTSAIRPIHLIVGKLFGATSMAWYFSSGFLLIGLYAYAHVALRKGGIGVEYPAFDDVFYAGVTVVVSAFIGHLFAVTGSLNNLAQNRSDALMPFMLGMVGAYFSSRILFTVFDLTDFSAKLFINPDVIWYNTSIPSVQFFVCSMIFFVGCAVVNLHRAARTVLSFQSYPFALIVFYALMSLYIGGFLFDTVSGVVPIWLCIFFVFLTGAYAYALSAAEDVGAYLRFFASVRRKNLKRILETVPRWLPLGGITLVALVTFFVVSSFYPSSQKAEIKLSSFMFFLTGLILFLVRDALVTHAISLGRRYRRAGLLRILYFSFAYFILPLLVFLVMKEGGVNGGQNIFVEVFEESDKYRYALGIFFPSTQSYALPALLPVVLEVVVAGWVLWRSCAVYRGKGRVASVK